MHATTPRAETRGVASYDTDPLSLVAYATWCRREPSVVSVVQPIEVSPQLRSGGTSSTVAFPNQPTRRIPVATTSPHPCPSQGADHWPHRRRSTRRARRLRGRRVARRDCRRRCAQHRRNIVGVKGRRLDQRVDRARLTRASLNPDQKVQYLGICRYPVGIGYPAEVPESRYTGGGPCGGPRVPTKDRPTEHTKMTAVGIQESGPKTQIMRRTNAVGRDRVLRFPTVRPMPVPPTPRDGCDPVSAMR